MHSSMDMGIDRSPQLGAFFGQWFVGIDKSDADLDGFIDAWTRFVLSGPATYPHFYYANPFLPTLPRAPILRQKRGNGHENSAPSQLIGWMHSEEKVAALAKYRHRQLSFFANLTRNRLYRLNEAGQFCWTVVSGDSFNEVYSSKFS